MMAQRSEIKGSSSRKRVVGKSLVEVPAVSAAAILGDAPLDAASFVAPLYIFGLGLEAGGAAETRLRAHPLVQSADVLVGGRRQLVHFEDHPAEKLLVGADIDGLLTRIQANRMAGKIQAVLCGGDPLYFSLGGRIAAYCKDTEGGLAGVRILPGMASVQAAAAILSLPWEQIRSVSLHGRDSWLPLAHALVSGEPIFLLIDALSTPGAIARFLHERGCDDYVFHILDTLYINAETGTAHAEVQQRLSMAEALAYGEVEKSPAQRVILLEPVEAGEYRDSDLFDQEPGILEGKAQTAPMELESVFGLPDDAVARDKNVLTKQPVRAAGLAALGIAPHHLVWDLGAGSGAVAIEACRLAWRGQVVAVEKSPERIVHIQENRRRFRAVNLEIVRADMREALAGAAAALAVAPGFPAGAADSIVGTVKDIGRGVNRQPSAQGILSGRPHRIFIGGGLAPSGEPGEILRLAWDLLLPGGRLVAHCVLLGSLELARHSLAALGATVSVLSIQAGKTKPLAGDVHVEGMNPVFLVCAEKPARGFHK